jgi:hypothetical protein
MKGVNNVMRRIVPSDQRKYITVAIVLIALSPENPI